MIRLKNALSIEQKTREVEVKNLKDHYDHKMDEMKKNLKDHYDQKMKSHEEEIRQLKELIKELSKKE